MKKGCIVFTVSGVASLIILGFGAVGLIKFGINEAAPLSKAKAVELLAAGDKANPRIDPSTVVPDSVQITRRPTSHSAEISASFRWKGSTVHRRGVLMYRPELIVLKETLN